MIRTLALAGLLAGLTVSQAAFAQSGFGTEGPYGRKLHTQAQSSMSRDWNASREAQNRAAASSAWNRRRHHGYPGQF